MLIYKVTTPLSNHAAYLPTVPLSAHAASLLTAAAAIDWRCVVFRLVSGA